MKQCLCSTTWTLALFWLCLTSILIFVALLGLFCGAVFFIISVFAVRVLKSNRFNQLTTAKYNNQLTLSHRQFDGMQRSLLHWNISSLHFRAAKTQENHQDIITKEKRLTFRIQRCCEYSSC